MSNGNSEERPIDVLIMAAGLGTRMRSGLAKVLHRLDGRPLINHVCSTAAVLGPEKIYVVIGHQGEDVKTAILSEMDADAVEFALQKEQLGTGDAVNSARGFLENRESTVVVLSGDVPLIRHETLSEMIGQHHKSGAACTVLTVKLDDPAGYGRVIRSEDGNFDRIVEQKDASDAERAVNEINSGIYCFDTKKLFAALAGVKNNNAQGEYYLTDVPAILRGAGDTVGLFVHDKKSEIEGINDRIQLAEMERLLRENTIERLMRESGVTFIDPQNTYISERAKFGRDTVVYPNVTIEGDSEIGSGSVIRSGSRITNSRIGDGVEILDNCVIIDSEVGNTCKVGPMAHLRGKAVMTEGSKVGNFVELKKTVLGKGSKASHLTYLGDATIGEKTNIGAGTITCNYDGKNKHQTEIGNNVRIGSDTMLVAPVKVGDGASTGAGSVVTKDIEPGDLVIGVPAKKMK
ncbi:MAG: bifunctional UDP-N-acetylglucosamine diphosphorylase/glucosamine-1-phosphate N-acetyltransferase GlmU [Acidobacteria bacterium]|nr:bifunctional UDP-N-acetylglucosamine diphosphorylase/glucosamine-1-phosphate N-acetyltransferase GlmU [Acidobacteriota bacterium]